MSIYTEEEASKKLCPLSFSGDEFTSCVASNCMGWRTITQRMQLSPEMIPRKSGWEKHGEPVDLGNGPQQHWQREAGYCGLAGKAQP